MLVFEKIKFKVFKVLHYIQHDFIFQRPWLGKDHFTESLVINNYSMAT